MSVKTTTVYNCDYCQKQLPDDYATTNGEGKGYYVKKAHDTIPLDTDVYKRQVQKYANEKKTEGEDFLAPLYFDLDYSENPAVAQEEAIKLVEFFTGELDIQEQDLHIYFSGSKGFHILVDERALGVEPRKDLQRVYKHIAGYLRYRLGEVQEQEDENGRPVEYTDCLLYTSRCV